MLSGKSSDKGRKQGDSAWSGVQADKHSTNEVWTAGEGVRAKASDTGQVRARYRRLWPAVSSTVANFCAVTAVVQHAVQRPRGLQLDNKVTASPINEAPFGAPKSNTCN